MNQEQNKKENDTYIDQEVEVSTDKKDNVVVKKIAKLFITMQRKPKTALLYMTIILALFYSLNLAIQMYSKEQQIATVQQVKGQVTDDLTNPSAASYSLQNYQVMTRLKDSLEYLMSKGDNLSHEDTLTFLRIVDQFHKIDPTLVETVMSIRKAQQEYPVDAEIPDIDAISADQDAHYNEIFSQQNVKK